MCQNYVSHTNQTAVKTSVIVHISVDHGAFCAYFVPFRIMLFEILIQRYLLRNFISADSWPQVFDDSDARRDWKWKHKYDLDKLVELMVRDVRMNYLKDDNDGN